MPAKPDFRFFSFSQNIDVNSEDPDQTAHVQSDQGFYYLHNYHVKTLFSSGAYWILLIYLLQVPGKKEL